MLDTSHSIVDSGTRYLDTRWADTMCPFPSPYSETSTRHAVNGGRLADDDEVRQQFALVCVDLLRNGDWDSLTYQPDFVDDGDIFYELSPINELARFVVQSRDRQLLRLFGQFLLAFKYEAVRAAYATLLRQWDTEAYRAFAALCAEVSAPPDAVPLPFHAWPRPPTAPLAPPICQCQHF